MFQSPDFTEDRYREICLEFNNKWNVLTVGSAYITLKTTEGQSCQNLIMLRHDVDVSLERAKAMATIEHEMGLSSTYLVRIRSEYYNVLESSQALLIEDIQSLGHEIGLHLDFSEASCNSKEEVEELIEKESRILNLVTGVNTGVVSYHNPTELILKVKDELLADKINCYSTFFEEQLKYLSDSNGYWRFDSLETLIAPKDNLAQVPLQLLIHPEWWQKEEMSPFLRIKRSIFGRADRILNDYETALRKHGRSNIGKP